MINDYSYEKNLNPFFAKKTTRGIKIQSLNVTKFDAAWEKNAALDNKRERSSSQLNDF